VTPNHTPLPIAEQFALPATLHPDRIDTGICSGPGTADPTIARALRRGAEPTADAEHAEGVAALLHYLSGDSHVPEEESEQA
jgi:alkanesulfonate monooxygenase SsuD/methylene tetrahydromethanopterin reductase-like flavin-dependent oxidoreductase (luciferase family)